MVKNLVFSSLGNPRKSAPSADQCFFSCILIRGNPWIMSFFLIRVIRVIRVLLSIYVIHDIIFYKNVVDQAPSLWFNDCSRQQKPIIGDMISAASRVRVPGMMGPFRLRGTTWPSATCEGDWRRGD